MSLVDLLLESLRLQAFYQRVLIELYPEVRCKSLKAESCLGKHILIDVVG